MHTATFNRAISRRRWTVATLLACALAAGGVSPLLPAADAAAARDLTLARVEHQVVALRQNCSLSVHDSLR